MEDHIRLLVYKNKSIYDYTVVSFNNISKYEKFSQNDIQANEYYTTENDVTMKTKLIKVNLRKKGFSSYLVSVYIHNLNQSHIYRKSAVNLLLQFIKNNTNNLKGTNVIILLKLCTPKYQFIDYGWNERITQMILEHREIDHAMSWLSTLGGAFSALGDKFDHCAKVAGKISVQQFKLSMQLGDPQLVARCNLYAALSLLQQGYLKTCKHMVKKIYSFAFKDQDVRLKRMCQGVWAKLKYTYSLRKSRIKKLRNCS